MHSIKKILVITPFFYPHIGGSEQYMEELYTHLVRQSADVTVDVLCYNTDQAREHEQYKGLTIHRIPCFVILRDQFVLPQPFALLKFLLQNGKAYDLIHSSTRFFDSSWWAPLYARLSGKKIILTDHCASSPIHPNPLIQAVVRLIDKLTGSIFLPLYDRVFVVSRATQKFLKEEFRVSSTLMYGGISEIASPAKGEARNDRIKILYLGRMIESKGVRDLFEVAKEFPDIDFLFAGPGELEKELKEEAKRLRLTNITILGKVERKNVPQLFEQCDIFVYPSYHSDGIPLAILQAGASSLAVIATGVGGVEEVIQNGKSGILIKPRDQETLKQSLITLSKNKALREQFGKSLSDHIKKTFFWEKASRVLYEEIQKL